MIVATAGHVDHGKTLLVNAITGVDTDRLAEEKARGLTIDLGFAYLHQNDQTLGFVDVPGHSRFIANMLAGIAAVDFGLLVIAADDGPMPQTREHLAILDLLGVRRGCIALTKIDRVDPARLEQVEQEIRALTANTTFADVRCFPVSGLTRQGIPGLVEFLWEQAAALEQQEIEGHFRLAVDRTFSVRGSGVVVTGSVFSGSVNRGDALTLYPQKLPVRVRGIHRQNQETGEGFAGDRCALNITGAIEAADISRGNWLAATDNLPVSQRLDAVLKLLPHEKPLRHWSPVHLHLAAQHATGRIAVLEDRHAKPGEASLVQLSLSTEISACYGDRFIIRDQAASRTLGGGMILDPFSPGRGRGRPERLAQLRALQETDLGTRIDRLLQASPAGVRIDVLQATMNLVNLPTGDGLPDETGVMHHPKQIERHLKRTRDYLKQALPADQQGRQISPRQLASALKMSDPLLQLMTERLIAAGELETHQQLLQRPGQAPTLPGPAENFWRRAEPILTEGFTKPPVLHELAKRFGLPPKTVEKLLGDCAQHGLVIRAVKNRYFVPAAIQALRQHAIALAEEQAEGFTVIQYRDRTDIGRNLCIEILEYFDSLGFTRRMNDHRIIQDRNR